MKTLAHRLILVTLAAILLISPSSVRLWQLVGNGQILEPANRADWQPMENLSPRQMDFGSPQDCIVYANQAVEIRDCQNPNGEIKWRSKAEWKVKEALAADLNRDGKKELVMVVWRPFKPWPIDSFLPDGGRIKDFHDRQNLSCHLILVGWDGVKYREMWAGSALIKPVFDIQVADLDQDGNQELVALEGDYDSTESNGNLTIWDWSGFGFRLRNKIAGHFSLIRIVSSMNDVLILTD